MELDDSIDVVTCDPLCVAISRVMAREVVCARPNLDVSAVVWLFLRQRLGCMPVVDEERHPIGIVTKLSLLEQLNASYHVLEAGYPLPPDLRVTARDLMSRFITVDERADIGSAASKLAREPTGHVLAVGHDGTLSGVVSAVDIVRWLDDHAAFETQQRTARGSIPPWRPLEG